MLFFVQLLALFCLSSLMLASKPATLATATAAQASTKLSAACQVKSYEALFAERKQIFNCLAQHIVLNDCAKIALKYYANPLWKLARELRLPGVSHVKSIAEYAPDKIAVSYDSYARENKGKKLVLIGDVRDQDQKKDKDQSNMKCNIPEELQNSLFVTTGKNNIIGACFDYGTRLAFINVENGKKRIVKPNNKYNMRQVTPIPDGLCAAVIDDEVIVIKDWTEEDELVVENLGRMPNSITALDSLPGNRLAVGDCGGYVNVHYPNERCRGVFRVGDGVETIVSLADDVMAISAWLTTKVPTNGSVHGFPVEIISRFCEPNLKRV